MRILMFFPGRVEHLPPLMSSAAVLADLGAAVTVLAAGAAPASAAYLERHGVTVRLASPAPAQPATRWGRGWLRARLGVELLRAKAACLPDCLWFHGPYAMEYAWLPGVCRGVRLVAHAHEHFTEPHLRLAQRRVLRRAHAVICPEVNRLWLLRLADGGPGRWFCIPNRPAADMLPAAAGEPETRAAFVAAGGGPECRKFLIYQGTFMADRCLETAVQAFRGVPDPEAGFILIGDSLAGSRHDRLKALAAADARVVLLPSRPFPRHLPVTAGCHAGVLLYAPTSLNNVYCAPNKLYEYAAMGLGMVLPDYPGLAALVREFGMGRLCDPLDPASVTRAMTAALAVPRQEWQRCARQFLAASVTPEAGYRDVLAALTGTAAGEAMPPQS
ncbi:MAG: glycosyltransferase [Lentisphaeria bacterium]